MSGSGKERTFPRISRIIVLIALLGVNRLRGGRRALVRLASILVISESRKFDSRCVATHLSLVLPVHRTMIFGKSHSSN